VLVFGLLTLLVLSKQTYKILLSSPLFMQRIVFSVENVVLLRLFKGLQVEMPILLVDFLKLALGMSHKWLKVVFLFNKLSIFARSLIGIHNSFQLVLS
jgi:hypothetical protein